MTMRLWKCPKCGTERRHPGYVIGDHWLQAAYDRICAGEKEAEVMLDYGWMRTEQDGWEWDL